MADGQPKNGGKHIWDNPKNVQRLLVAFWIGCAVMIVLDGVISRVLTFKHDELPIESLFGFYGLYGFVACVILVLIAKQMRRFLMRDEDYYDG